MGNRCMWRTLFRTPAYVGEHCFEHLPMLENIVSNTCLCWRTLFRTPAYVGEHCFEHLSVLCACLQGLLDHLAANCDGSLKTEVTALAARYEHRLQLGSKTIYHIEAFIANFMKIYKRFLEEGMHDMF